MTRHKWSNLWNVSCNIWDPSGNYTYQQRYVQQLCLVPTQCMLCIWFSQ